MADRAIQVAVLEGYFASLSAQGFPMLLSLQLQQSDLRLNAAMWTAKSSKADFSVSFFWPVANPNDPGVKNLKNKKTKRKRRKAKASSTIEVSSVQAKSVNSESGSPSIAIDANHDGPYLDKSLAVEPADQPAEEEEVIDLIECTDVMYEKKNGIHGVKYVCGESDGWTSVVGKRKNYKVPTCLIRLRVPPHVRANLPSSNDSSDSDSSGSDCPLNIPAGASVLYSQCGGKPGLRVTTSSTATWTPISSRT